MKEVVDGLTSTQRYYERCKLAIIKRKTLKKVRTTGRIPRQKTLEKNGIGRGEVVAAMCVFLGSE